MCVRAHTHMHTLSHTHTVTHTVTHTHYTHCHTHSHTLSDAHSPNRTRRRTARTCSRPHWRRFGTGHQATQRSPSSLSPFAERCPLFVGAVRETQWRACSACPHSSTQHDATRYPPTHALTHAHANAHPHATPGAGECGHATRGGPCDNRREGIRGRVRASQSGGL